MATKALFDEAGLPLKFFPDDIYEPEQIPAEAVLISDGDWREFLDNPERRRWDGEKPVPCEPPPPPLAEVKERLKSWVNAAAEDVRLKYITPGAGQAMEYQAVQAEAERVSNDPAPIAGAYPMLSATIGVDIDPQTGAPAVDVQGVGRSVQAARLQWAVIGAAIRRIRLAVKAGIEAASNEAEANAAATAGVNALKAAVDAIEAEAAT